MTNQVQLQPGIYTNIFPVILPTEPVKVMIAEREKYPDLRALRNELAETGRQVSVYAAGNCVCGYGQQASKLASKEFHEEDILLQDHPALTARFVIDGLVDAAKRAGLTQQFLKGRARILRPNPHGVTRNGKVKVFLGYDLRCVYYEEVQSFGLIVDIAWNLIDETGQSLNTPQLKERGVMNEVTVIQEEYLRGTTQFNLQISQIRMQNYLLPFVQEFSSFSLPCGGSAQLEPEPFRVILGGRP
jgi:hypothetical protein